MKTSNDISIFCKDWTIEVRDTDFKNFWKPSGVLIATQQLGEDHGALLGCSHIDMVNNGVFFIMARQKMDMQKYPEFNDIVKVVTWLPRPTRTIIPRYFEIFLHGELIGTVSTIWMICKASDRSILTPDQAGVSFSYADKSPLAHPGKIKLPNVPHETISRTCLYSDADYNGHMNNTRYADWVCDAMNFSDVKSSIVSSMQINYLKEVRPGDQVDMDCYETDDSFTVHGKIEGESAFQAEVKLLPRI